MSDPTMGPDWDHVWHEDGDDVWRHKTNGWVRLDVSDHCPGHERGTFCAACFPKVDRVITVARHVLAGKKPPGGGWLL